jgi:hypothetical protein
MFATTLITPTAFKHFSLSMVMCGTKLSSLSKMTPMNLTSFKSLVEEPS